MDEASPADLTKPPTTPDVGQQGCSTKQEGCVGSKGRAKNKRKKRKKHIESLRGKEFTLWLEVHELIGTRQPNRYDEAVSLLQDLHDLAELQGDESGFQMKMSALNNKHERKSTLVERFRKEKLLGEPS